jgi:hypothetical protein
MYMRGYVDAFRELLNAVRGADHLEALKLYAITAALFRDMRDCAELEYPERPVTYSHTIEKLECFMDAFSCAVMGRPSEQMSEVELLQSAEQYLMSATSNWPGDDWV